MQIKKPNYYQMNQDQFACIVQLLPKGYSLQLWTENQKRIRIAKLPQSIYSPTSVQPKVKLITPQKTSVKNKIKQASINSIQQKVDLKNGFSNKQKPDILKQGKQIERNVKEEDIVQMYQNNSLKNCMRILNRLKKHQSAWPFLKSVDPVALQVPNYLKIVKQPMDLQEIERRLKNNVYEHPAEFHSDISKIFINSYKFNPKKTIYYECTVEFESYYNQITQQLKDQMKSLKQPKKLKKDVDLPPNRGKEKKSRNIEEMKRTVKKIQNFGSKKLQKLFKIIYKEQTTNLNQQTFYIDLCSLNHQDYQQVLKYVNDSHSSNQHISPP